MPDKLWMPVGASPWFWASVFGCFVFWLVAYGLIVKLAFKEKTFGMPLVALCWNISWEFVFSNILPPDYLLVQYGSDAWLLFDAVILYTAWKFGPADFPGWAGRFIRPGILAGLAVGVILQIPFAKVYNDLQGYLLGWMAALIMSLQFIELLLRRDSVKGQSIYIALAMFLGNVSAFVWIKFYPREMLKPELNLLFLCTTGFFNLAYVAMLYVKCKAMGINPWKRW